MVPTYIGAAVVVAGVVIQFATSLPDLLALGIVAAGTVIGTRLSGSVRRRSKMGCHGVPRRAPG